MLKLYTSGTQPCSFNKGSNSFKKMEVLKFALRVLDCNGAVFADVGKIVYNVILYNLTLFLM